MKKLAIGLFLFFVFPNIATSHPGRTDSNGGHFNRKTGEYHCHSCPSRSSGRGSSSNSSSSKRYGKKSYSEDNHSSDSGSTSRLLVYNRKNWRHRIDADRDCQNTRDEILIRDSEMPVQFKSDKGCKVVSGNWIGPYTGKRFTNPRKFGVYHIVPLMHAFEVGGALWSKKRKMEFANDFENLLAADAGANRTKGKKPPNEWMPPRQSYWCEYASQWIDIKNKYGLRFREEETKYLNRVS